MTDAPAIIRIRAAAREEIPVLNALIARSARKLSRDYYTPAETEAAITHIFGVDTELVADGTYLVATDGARLLGCGGWSRRNTLFGGDRFAGRAAGLLDPATDAARIRAFFVAPDRARGGVGSALLAACEEAARAAGFGAVTLMATLPGIPFYARHGYASETETMVPAGGVTMCFVKMRKSLLHKRDINLHAASCETEQNLTQ